jgi:general secretion pathway protein A
MYKEFFNFSAEPFRVTPDPGFLYLTDQHKEALAAIIYGIAKRKGFVCITGEVGVGKTTIVRSYLDSVDEPGLRFVSVFNPNVSFQALLRHMLRDLGVDHPGDEIAGMVEALRGWLLQHHKRRETLVLLIDEAQNMPIGTLEQLRMLSNLETATEKLIQIVLVGQPELDQLLSERQLRQLESRIAVRTRLGPLSKADSTNYIRHRLKCVALDDKPAFTDGAVKEIVRHARGIPRRINVLADNALMNAYGRKLRPVTVKVVREVVRDMRLKDAAVLPKASSWWPLAVGGGLAATVAALALGWAMIGDGGRPTVTQRLAPLQPPVTASAPMPPPPDLPRIEPRPAVPEPVPAALPAPPPESEPVEPELAGEAMPTTDTALASLAAVAEEERRQRILRIVAPGDTLAGLTFEVYGRLDGQALGWVKEHNPDITNVDRIQVGQVIEFPAIPGGGYD